MPGIPPDKTYNKNNIKYEVYYNDDGSLGTCHTTERTDDYKITCDYDSDGSLMYRCAIYYNDKGVPRKEEVWNYLQKEKEEHFETYIPIFEGYEDASKMSDEDKKELNNLIRAYLSTARKKYDPSNDVPW